MSAPPNPTKAALSRRRNAAKRRDKIVNEGRRIDLLLPAEPAAALAQIEQQTGERATPIIARLLIDHAAIGKPHPDYTDPKVFYASEAWKTLRYLALRNSGGRCQCCGASAKDGATLHVDHIVSRYKAPCLELELSNLQVLCLDCNTGKGAWDSTDWREHWKSI